MPTLCNLFHWTSTGFAILTLVLSVALTTAVTPAQALPVTFAGEVDSGGPLIIDPAPDDDPQTLTVSSNFMDVYFIERMPQTKTVTNITLGDFGQDSCSSSTPKARLFVTSRADNDYNGAAQQIAYTNEVPLPATPSRLSFSFEWVRNGGSTLLLSAGRAYTFQLSISGCSKFKQTTWAPLEPKFETPNRTCRSSLPFGPSGIVNAKMQWHDGLTLPDSACVNWLQNLWNYEPDGWLVSIRPGPAYIDMIQNIGAWAGDPDSQYNHYCDRSQWPGRNVSQVNVLMPSGNPTTQLDGVCRWNAYYPPGQVTRYSWSTAIPLRGEFNGGPRMPYLKLDVVNWENTLLQQYAPALKLDTGEAFLPEDARGIASIAASNPDCSDDTNGLSHRSNDVWDPNQGGYPDTGYARAGSDACPQQNRLQMDDLGPEGAAYPYTVDGNHPVVSATDDIFGDHLSLRGGSSTMESDSTAIYATPGWGNHVYGRVFQAPTGDLWLQYFFWYYYNNGYTVIPGADDHEGDWEGIQVHIPNPFVQSPVPDHATYNEHSFRSVCGWNLVEKANGHPVVYVSKGRHASYFTPDKMPSGASDADGSNDPNDDDTNATVNSPSTLPHVEPISAYTPTWIRWPGRWGDSTGDFTGQGGTSPLGPATFSSWKDPADWDSNAVKGGHNADVACPDAAPPSAQAAKVGTHRLRTHSTAGVGAGPSIRWTRAGRGQVRVTWSLPKGTSTSAPVTLELEVHATRVLFPASVKNVSLRTGRRHGTVALRLPRARGPFELVGQVLHKDGRWSSETMRAVPG